MVFSDFEMRLPLIKVLITAAIMLIFPGPCIGIMMKFNISENRLHKLFGFNSGETSIRTEITAGITTFLTMAYILAVNPGVLGSTGMDKGALFTTTALMAALPTILMGIYAKLPLALTPAMGINAFFAYTVCLIMGYSWQMALTAVFVEGLIFMFLTITKLREKIVYIIPDTLKNAICAGIGLFIAFIGLRSAGIIANNDATLVALGDMTSATPVLGVVGIVLTSVLLVKRIKGALLFGILITTLLGIPLGVTHMEGIFSAPPSIEPIFLQFEWDQLFSPDLLVVIFTLLFVDLFDSVGTVIGLTSRAGLVKPDGTIPHLKEIFIVDSLATTVGAMMGTSTVTVCVENAAGVNEGGRCGLTAVTTGVCFLLALFFAPLFLSIPAVATAPALILVGVMMFGSVLKINFEDYSEAISAFICILLMPLSYSISDGIVMGHLSYVFINLVAGNRRKLNMGMYVLAVVFLLKFCL